MPYLYNGAEAEAKRPAGKILNLFSSKGTTKFSCTFWTTVPE